MAVMVQAHRKAAFFTSGGLFVLVAILLSLIKGFKLGIFHRQDIEIRRTQ